MRRYRHPLAGRNDHLIRLEHDLTGASLPRVRGGVRPPRNIEVPRKHQLLRTPFRNVQKNTTAAASACLRITRKDFLQATGVAALGRDRAGNGQPLS